MSVTVRQLGRQDADAYRALRLKALQTEPKAFGSDYEREVVRDAGWFADATERNGIFGAFAGETLIGMVGFFQSDMAKSRHIGHLVGLYVDPGYRGRGAGRQLVAAVIAHAKGKVLQLYLGVGAYNTAAQTLYARCGFERYGTEPRALHIEGRYIDEHLMVRFLDSEE